MSCQPCKGWTDRQMDGQTALVWEHKRAVLGEEGGERSILQAAAWETWVTRAGIFPVATETRRGDLGQPFPLLPGQAGRKSSAVLWVCRCSRRELSPQGDGGALLESWRSGALGKGFDVRADGKGS